MADKETFDLVEDAPGVHNVQTGKMEQDAAARGTQRETELTVLAALKYYKKAVMWSLAISMATIMESYDLILINSFFAHPQFQKKFGQPLNNGTGGYTLSTQWQIGLSMAGLVGLIPGVFANGILVDRYGYRKVMAASHIFLIGAIFGTFFASSAAVLTVGVILISLPCGVFAAATPGYAAEVCPMALRGYLTTYVNLCWVMGHLIGAGVLIAKLKDPTEWSYRLPFAIQWIWPPFLAVACWFAPESPWWLVRQNRLEDARKTMDRILDAPEGTLNKDDIIAMMDHTIQTERAMEIGGSYLDCFRGTNLRRTEIAMISWGCQILPGFAIQNYSTYFFTMAGLSSNDSFKMTLGNYSIAFTGTVLSWFIQTRFGRRQIYLAGLTAMLPLMATVGFLDLAPPSASIRWAQSGLLLTWFFCYGSTIGPIPFAIAAEVGASRLRTKTISLGRNTYYFLSVVNTVVAPYMLNPTAGNLKGKAAFPAFGLTVILLVWTFFRLPETKGLTPETLDHLFHQRVPARKFKEEAKHFQ
ncbi:uncharacterized protein E0L32_010610 [Thyridium curvatum]|uniref:Major facilitator superfamily (MFS) profile domain-containing protein n=1 Tax=Thyridium curvatum TaxID=1093900 RepID=A0A507AN62_9PEZI|nr:uncharacterized protein E0L32_010610 [Thyridium curvatum]TPX07714.1 hypothetical protein E0L32_010610 [Thyridium curvatum]